MSLRPCLAVCLLCVALSPAVCFAAAPPRLSNQELIDRLRLVRQSDYGYSPTANGPIFLPLDSEGEFLGGMLFQAPPTPSETMRELVRRGVSAVPHLVAHLNDKRPTRLVIEALAGGFLIAGEDPRYKNNPLGIQGPTSYTVTVGDLCSIALGQTINRGQVIVSYFPSARTS